MPYTRAYRLPVPPLRAEVEQKFDSSLNITPSSNWIQETFNSRSLVEDEERGPVFVIEKTKQPSLYQRIRGMQTRSRVCKITVIASDPVPSGRTIEKLEEISNGDPAELEIQIQKWKAEIIERYREINIGEGGEVLDDLIYLNGNSILGNGDLDSIRLTIFSPDMPTRGDQPVTAIYYSAGLGAEVIDGGVKAEPGQISAIAREPIPFTWTDKSGFRSTMVIFPNTIYEIQPVSIELGYEITLLS